MKPLAHANEKQPPGATAGRTDESFNFDDLSAQDAPQGELREPREAKQEQQVAAAAATARSPSPSALSTASSASPLIRSNSSSSSTTTGSQGRHSATGWRPSPPTGGPRRAHHLAPTSIAVAQLQQQQQRQQLAMQQQQQQQQQQQEKSKSSPRMSKFASGNKLAQMATTQQQVSEAATKNKSKKAGAHEHGVGHHEGKSFGYNLGKMMAHRASRFNEFWSVNKMRYMNLACLLMTLVCLITILLFSKSGGGGGGHSLATLDTAAASQQQRAKQYHAHPQHSQRHRFAAASDEQKQPATTNGGGEDEQERPIESIDSLDRQPFVRASRKNALTVTSGGGGGEYDDEQTADSTASGGANSADGFNLFDEMDSPAPAANGKRSLDDLLQDARRQLKRQQENERAAEESTTAATSGGGGQATSTEQPADDKLDEKARKLAPIMDPLLSQVLGDLDGFGLFKSIKSQLLDQLNESTPATSNGTGSGGGELFAAGKPIIRRGKNGATIIMSFGGSLLGDKPQLVNGSRPEVNGTQSAQQLPSLGSALERLLLPPPLAMMLGAGGLGGKLPAQGFARITINSAEPTILRSSSPFEAGAPLPLFARSPFMPYESAQSPARVFAFGDSAPSPAASTGGGGFMSMILRASSDLARQMDKQLGSKTVANQTQAAGNSTQAELKPEASQQVKVTAGGASQAGENDDAEVETFDVGRMMMGGGRLPVSPFHSLYSGARALRPPPLIMFGGSPSGGAPDSPPFGLMPPPAAAGSMFMMGSGGGVSGSRPPLSLSSILSDVMSTMAREASGGADRRGDPDSDTPTSSGPDDEESPPSSSSSWDEQPANGRLSRSRHQSLELDAGDGSERDETESHFRRSPVSSSSSLLEHLLNGGPHATRRTFGTIRQTFRGPDGVTVERVIEMPPRVRHFAVQSVPAGVRSQSISSRVGDPSPSGQDRAPASARMMRELAPPDSSAQFAGARPLFSRGPGPLIGRLFRELESDSASEDGGSTVRGLERSDAQPNAPREEPQRQDEVEMPHWRHQVRRIHIAGPRISHQLPHHFSLPATPSRPPLAATADERPQASGEQQKPTRDDGASSPHSSPSSPLFGFPALKPTFKSPQVVAGVTEPLTAAAATATIASQRQPRAFVYHSNHEMARQLQQPEQARARSAGSEPRVAPASASMVMGRRLDDFVDQRR